MMEIQRTIEQAMLLGSRKMLRADKIHELRRRSITLSGEINPWNLITESFDYGFAEGYKQAQRGIQK